MVPKKGQKITISGLGVFSIHDRVFLYGIKNVQRFSTLLLQISTDGINFYPSDDPKMVEAENKPVSYAYIKEMRFSSFSKTFFLCAKIQKPASVYLAIFSSLDLINWKLISTPKNISGLGQIIPEYEWQGKKVMFFGHDSIKMAYSSDLIQWEIQNTPLLTPRPDHFDYGALSIGSVTITPEGIVLIYTVTYGEKRDIRYGLGIALFDKNNPSHLLWRSPISFFDQPDRFSYKRVNLIGIAQRTDAYISYWQFEHEEISAITHPKYIIKNADKITPAKLKLKKLQKNPILTPITSHPWESKAVFNPAALYDEGKVHLLYRAVGDSDGSVIGYASSSDGTTIDQRLDKPVFVPSQPFERSDGAKGSFQTAYFSGGLYGGCEDPRMTKIGNRIYMTYVAYDGAHPPRVALTSIDNKDFHDKNWDWTTPVLISPPGVVDKNACILPEKINGKYVIFHRIFPNILIDFVDDLDFDGKTYLKGEFFIGPRHSSWDSRKIGAGPPPMKTKDGWLLIYHAVGDRDSTKYKMGAMLLDLKDPTKVLHRSKYPILEPDEWYENDGLKYGVAYPCGATILKNNLIVYYGGSDMVTCAATTPLDEFLSHLQTDEIPQLHSVSFKPHVLAKEYAS